MIFAITWSINIQVLPSYSNICLSATPSQNGMSRYFLWPRVDIETDWEVTWHTLITACKALTSVVVVVRLREALISTV